MKSFNLLFALVVFACIGLSFISSEGNNLLQPNNSNSSAATATVFTGDCDGLEDWLQKELLQEVENVLQKHDPHVFMTKCYSRVEFEWEKEDNRIQKQRNGDSKGTLVFINCNQRVELAKVRVNCTEKSIRLRTSATSPAQTKAEYLESLDAQIKAHGIPNDNF